MRKDNSLTGLAIVAVFIFAGLITLSAITLPKDSETLVDPKRKTDVVDKIEKVVVQFKSKLKYKTFKTHQQALHFIAERYKDASPHVGGAAWWSTHRLVVIPEKMGYQMEYNTIVKYSYKWKYLVYHKD